MAARTAKDNTSGDAGCSFVDPVTPDTPAAVFRVSWLGQGLLLAVLFQIERLRARVAVKREDQSMP
jgi:hypothetical protein